jgi:hypothetical protein
MAMTPVCMAPEVQEATKGVMQNALHRRDTERLRLHLKNPESQLAHPRILTVAGFIRGERSVSVAWHSMLVPVE